MKIITKTFAILFATAAFAACTNQSIESVRPVTQTNSDTTYRSVQNPYQSDPQIRKYQSEKMILTEGVDQSDTQPIVEPAYPVSVPSPRPAVMPVEQLSAPSN